MSARALWVSPRKLAPLNWSIDVPRNSLTSSTDSLQIPLKSFSTSPFQWLGVLAGEMRFLEQVSAMKIHSFLLPYLLVLALSTPLFAQELTLEKIMSHPRWIGAWPEEVKYSPDGQSLYYLSHADPRGYEVVEIDTGGEVIKIHETSGLPGSGDRLQGKTVYSFQGDLVLSDPTPGRLTRTERSESECRWLGTDKLFYRGGDDYFVRDLKSNVERQVVKLLYQNEPKVGEDFRSKQQDRLFPSLKEKEEAQKRRAQAQNIPQFYVGKGRELVRLELTNNQQFALLVHAAEDTTERDKMPVYLNRDGSVSSQKLRAKVGAVKAKDHRLLALDLQRKTSRPIALSDLPNMTSETTVYLEDTKWSESGRLALSLFSEDFEERWIVEVDIADASLKLVEHLHDDAWHAWDLNEFGWSGESLWYQSEKTGYAHLYLWNGQTSTALTSGKFEVTSVHPHPNGKYFFLRTNKGNSGRYDVYQVKREGGALTKVTDLGGQVMFDLSPDGEKLAILHSKTATPPEIYLQEARPAGALKKLTKLASRQFLDHDWTLPKFVMIPSTHHSRPIRSKLYLPKKANGAAVVFVHGAGYLQNADEGWSYYFREFMFHTLLTQQGVTVLDMDYRASAGYGRDWRAAIYRQMGTPELEDLKDGVAYLVRNHDVQSDRVGIYGGSYGGFLTLMTLFKEPDLFACGAALRPVTDWAQYEHGYTARILNTPDEDPESYLRSSPIEFAEGLTKPLLMCHGMLDDNVVAQDTVRLTQRLIQLEKEDWETALYPIEPHGFVEPESWLDEYRRIYKLFRTNLAF